MNSSIQRAGSFSDQQPSRAAWSDEELMSAYCRQTDREAFEELVHRYEHELFNYLRRFLGHAEMAEEVFQNTFLQVHLKCNQFQEGRRLRPWLYTVATNQAIDAQRRNRRHKAVSLDRPAVANSSDDDLGALVDLLQGNEVDPSQQCEAVEWRQAVRMAIDQLPETLRLLINLVYYQGLKYREAAEALSIPVGTVKSRLHSAIYNLNLMLCDSPAGDKAHLLEED